MPVKPFADLPTGDSGSVAPSGLDLSAAGANGASCNGRDIACVSHGHGPALAVVMAPVMPYWDEGQFFAPLTERLVALGYRVMIFDSLSLQPAPGDLPSFADAWRRILQGLGPIQLLAGGALGGAVVQSLLASRWAAQIPATLLISAPTQADARLDERLGYMAQLAAAGELTTALRWLDHWVAADTNTPVVRGLAPERPDVHCAQHQPQPLGGKPPHHKAMASACERLQRGFGLLAKLDLRSAVHAYPGKLLSLYGEQSHLVRASNVSFPRTARHLAASIPASGMRPHMEQPARVWACVQEHLHLSAQIAP